MNYEQILLFAQFLKLAQYKDLCHHPCVCLSTRVSLSSSTYLFTHNSSTGYQPQKPSLGGEKPHPFLKLSALLRLVFFYLEHILTKRDGCSFSIHICHINDDNFSQPSAARSFVLGTSPQELTTPYPSFLLQAPSVYRNIIKSLRKHSFASLQTFFL